LRKINCSQYRSQRIFIIIGRDFWIIHDIISSFQGIKGGIVSSLQGIKGGIVSSLQGIKGSIVSSLHKGGLRGVKTTGYHF
jgi:hypothetical protein